MSSSIKVLDLIVEEGFIIELDRLAEASETTRAEVIDRAIGLYATLVREAEQGKTIQFVHMPSDDNSEDS